jgi:hypothetical protein
MAALYRKEILKEPVPETGFVPLGNLVAPSRPLEENSEAAEPVLGD